jgi:hypothetical protein
MNQALKYIADSIMRSVVVLFSYTSMSGSALYRKETNGNKVKTVPTYVVRRPEGPYQQSSSRHYRHLTWLCIRCVTLEPRLETCSPKCSAMPCRSSLMGGDSSVGARAKELTCGVVYSKAGNFARNEIGTMMCTKVASAQIEK